MKRIARVLIKYRHFLLILMIALGVAGVCMLPEVKIVSDMTTYLPDDSRMKHGLDNLKSSFSGIDINGAGVSAMLSGSRLLDAVSTVTLSPYLLFIESATESGDVLGSKANW